MKGIDIKKVFKIKATGNIIIVAAVIVLTYFIISVYFAGHFFFRTTINGIDVSLKSHKDVYDIIRCDVKNYRLQLNERDGVTEQIVGQDIEMKFNENNSFAKLCKDKNAFMWGGSLFKQSTCYVDDLFAYNEKSLEKKISELNCLNKEIAEPKNVSFQYLNGFYEVVKEIYGNKIYKDKLIKAIEKNICEGKTKLDLNENNCYENPKYTSSSKKTTETKNLLNKYVGTKIIYLFGKQSEILDESKLNQWLSVDEDLNVVIDEKAVSEYVGSLSKKYDTVGIPRQFKASTGKVVEVSGGFYGWKINKAGETKALLGNIKRGIVLEKDPLYTQKGITRDKDDIGSTYVEINITMQHLWFYKNGKLITQGDVVTGNPNNGNATSLGVYMLNYKQKGSTLRGENYEADVTYWMPFNGNIGVHDATWRYSFGGDIYKSNGTHGCVNAPLYLAKTIFENIEPGTPIICYEE